LQYLDNQNLLNIGRLLVFVTQYIVIGIRKSLLHCRNNDRITFVSTLAVTRKLQWCRYYKLGFGKNGACAPKNEGIGNWFKIFIYKYLLQP